MKKKKLIYRYLSTIIFTSFFLVFSTVFIYLPKQENYVGAFSYLGKITDVKLVSKSKDLVLDLNYPVSDIEGIESKPYVFELENTKNKEVRVQVTFKLTEGASYVKYDTVKYMVLETGGEIKELDSNGIIVEDVLKASESKTYNLKFWLQEEKMDDIFDKYFQATIDVKTL